MADTKPSLSPVGASPSLPPKVYFGPMGQRIEGLDKSQSELLARLQGLKLELQNWRLNLDTQFKTYKDELLELKKALNSEVNQLRSEFKELRTTLQEQQDNVTIDHKNMVVSMLSPLFLVSGTWGIFYMIFLLCLLGQVDNTFLSLGLKYLRYLAYEYTG
ncbi:uncharacterized protein [Typha latifolia]|uniref:uncharacterized protein isoform X2 n=1 Tax=Typha latifolia TaxID=4733 RepID=UPI003C2B109B